MLNNSLISVVVLVLKAPSEDFDKKDIYIETLEKANIPSKFIPTLQFRFKNLDILQRCLNNPQNYAGIIFSSARCVRAVVESLKNESLKSEWMKLKCFVVGEATGRLVKNELDLNFEGQLSGNLCNLIQYISQYNFDKPLLMPVSALHKDQETNIKLEKVEVYETYEHENLGLTLKDAFNPDITTVIVFFSPSGVKSAIRHISSFPSENFRFIAIGPTTAAEMKKYNLTIHGVCKTPNPESLKEIVFQCFTENAKKDDNVESS